MNTHKSVQTTGLLRWSSFLAGFTPDSNSSIMRLVINCLGLITAAPAFDVH